jgi:DNA-binding transcriptional regulator YdaS (Cro superfamily)
MALPQYTPEQRRLLADAVGVDEQYIYQIMRKLKTASPALAKQINAADENAQLCDLRPDDWHLIWPELAKPTQEVTHG